MSLTFCKRVSFLCCFLYHAITSEFGCSSFSCSSPRVCTNFEPLHTQTLLQYSPSNYLYSTSATGATTRPRLRFYTFLTASQTKLLINLLIRLTLPFQRYLLCYYWIQTQCRLHWLRQTRPEQVFTQRTRQGSWQAQISHPASSVASPYWHDLLAQPRVDGQRRRVGDAVTFTHAHTHIHTHTKKFTNEKSYRTV